MIYEYIIKNFKEGEPIFLNEIPGKSREAVRQEMKRLVDKKKLKRMRNGVYYIPYKTMLNTDGRITTRSYIEKKYLYNQGRLNGYYTGLAVANEYGFTSQNSGVYEICSNAATTTQRKVIINERRVFIYKPKVPITEENISSLQFLDLMTVIKMYSEIKGEEYKKALREYVKENEVNFNEVKKYISFYPKVVYKNIYEGGLMNELV